MGKIYVINGPNLNFLGCREPEIYGEDTLDSIQQWTNEQCQKRFPHVELCWYQSNLEGDLINWVQEAAAADGVVINPAGYSHSSVALADALKMVKCPKVEVHLSKVAQRENFRQQLITATGVDALFEGAGKFAYLLAIEYIQLLKK